MNSYQATYTNSADGSQFVMQLTAPSIEAATWRAEHFMNDGDALTVESL